MKEAAGEANMTVITIVLIGVVAAVGAVFIPRLLNNLKAQSCCTEQGGTFSKAKGICNGGAMNGLTVSQMRERTECK